VTAWHTEGSRSSVRVFASDGEEGFSGVAGASACGTVRTIVSVWSRQEARTLEEHKRE
jgi:hypothetical protein